VKTVLLWIISAIGENLTPSERVERAKQLIEKQWKEREDEDGRVRILLIYGMPNKMSIDQYTR
jgi:hypothetical protein